MKQKILSLCVATVMAIVQAYGGVTLTVPEVSVAQGGTSYVVIQFDLGTPTYTAYQLDIAYPEGISSVISDNGNPAFIKGDIYSNEHSVSSTYTPSGLDRFQCFSVNSVPFTAQSGTLLILPIKARKSLAEGTYQATISPIEFVQTDATPDRPNAITFNINVSKYVVLDETSIMPPIAATAVDVIVKRTINANEWSTLCLPFAMTTAQVEAAFGQLGTKVWLADFTGYETTEDADENIVGISVKFGKVEAIEANHPYLIKVSEAVSSFTVDGVNVAPVENPIVNRGTKKHPKSFVGTYAANTAVPDFGLFLNGNQFYYSNGATKMKAFRGYFDFDDVLTEVDNASAASRIFLSYDNEATSIGEIGVPNVLKGAVYNLNGQFLGTDVNLKSLPKGIYMVDGKKVVNY